MNLFKRLPVVCLLLLVMGNVRAQNTNSVYSRYGYGTLESPAFGASRSMGGIGYGYHDRTQINALNPAAFSDVDTLNLLFDFGVSAQSTTLRENGLKQQNPNGSFDYAAAKFALKPNWGIALGMYAYSKVGYSFSKSYSTIGEQDLDFVQSYSGSGGLNTAFIGTGMKLVKGLSLGATFTYTFGSLENTTGTTFTNSDVHNSLNNEFLILRFPGANFGIQYDFKTAPKDVWTLGASYSLSSQNKGEYIVDKAASDTTESITNHNFGLGSTLGFGISYRYDKRLTLGLDVQRRTFSKALFMGVQDSLKDETRVAVGMEYLPSANTNDYFKAIHYRAGLNWTDQYLKVPGKLQSAALTLGACLPLPRPLSGKPSSLNIGFEIGKLFPPNSAMIKETYYKVTLGLTFNEPWFFHFKL